MNYSQASSILHQHGGLITCDSLGCRQLIDFTKDIDGNVIKIFCLHKFGLNKQGEFISLGYFGRYYEDLDGNITDIPGFEREHLDNKNMLNDNTWQHIPE